MIRRERFHFRLNHASALAWGDPQLALGPNIQVPGDDPNRWLFPGEGEHPLHQNSVGYLWRKARGAAGVDYRLHDLRHFYASGLIAAGCDVVTVQRAMGHKSATVTLNTYGHRWPKAEDRTRKAAAVLFADAVSTTADRLRTDNG